MHIVADIQFRRDLFSRDWDTRRHKDIEELVANVRAVGVRCQKGKTEFFYLPVECNRYMYIHADIGFSRGPDEDGSARYDDIEWLVRAIRVTGNDCPSGQWEHLRIRGDKIKIWRLFWYS